MIRELTASSWNILARFEAEERAGRLSRAEARTAALLILKVRWIGLRSVS